MSPRPPVPPPDPREELHACLALLGIVALAFLIIVLSGRVGTP